MKKTFLIFPALLILMSLGVAHGKVLDSLVIEGLTNARPNYVRNSIVLRDGESFRPNDVQESVRRLYATGLFRSVRFLVLEESQESASLLLEVEEYPVCENIEFVGNRRIKDDELLEELDFGRMQVVTDELIHESRRKLAYLYREKGYHLAQIEVEAIDTKVPGYVILKYDIDEGPRVRVEGITFKGNEHIRDRTLARRFKTKENRWYRAGRFDEQLYRSHLDSLVMYYNEQGFLDAAILDDQISYSECKTELYLEITIDEGRRYYVGDLYFRGNTVLDDEKLASRVALNKGEPFRMSRFEQTRMLIEDAYREEGHLWVNVNDNRSFDGDTINLVMEVFEGRPAIINRIDVKGNSKTMEKVIRREIELVPGQRYRQSQMVRSQQNIFRLNYFNNVMPDLRPNEDGTIDLIFNIEERDNIGQLTIGAAYSEVDRLTGTFSTAIPNFRGAGQELKVDLQYGQRRQTVNLGFTEPWAFDTPWLLRGDVFYDRSVYSRLSSSENKNVDEESQSYGFRAGVGRSRLSWPDDKFRINAVYQLSRERTNYDTISLPGLQVLESGILNRLTVNIERYDFDMPLFPNQGSRLTIRPQIAFDFSRFASGEDRNRNFQYFKGTVGYEQYFQLPWNFVLGSESKIGLISGLGNDVRISRLDLFSAGGVYSDGTIRGYPDFAFGGRYSRDGDGMAMFTSSLQLRYPLVDQQVYLALFADIGNTWAGLSDVDLTDLYKGVGFGIRVNVPMLGIMGFDFAWGLDDLNRDYFRQEPNGFQLHFLMNTGF
ncbi:Outer membrane protein assembly factor YaeT precursor [Chitinispirillum alkaliphilum]|nr:Outer membrane protein assembly factor YaeT precursor [Chitinispirillum alkaliphilum]